jgi:hypothetical protein
VTLHLAPNVPWIPVALLVVALVALAAWAYRFSIPPLPALARRVLPALRAVALALLVALLAQPVLERAISGSSSLLVLVDRSLSMQLPVAPGRESRAAAADRAVRDVANAWRGRGRVVTMPFAERLAEDSAGVGNAAVTNLGNALATLAESPQGETAGGVVVVSDGSNNAGIDPVEAARRLGLPVHALRTGATNVPDRAVLDVEAPTDAQVGRVVPLRVHVASHEARGTLLVVSLRDESRELAHATVISPGPGAEAVAELRATPLKPGLAVWTARVDSIAGELTTRNNARQVAFPVAPGRLRVTLVTTGLNWDFTFVRRALVADSSLELKTYIRTPSGWRVEPHGNAAAPGEADLAGAAVVVLDATSPAELGPAFDAALVRFVERGGGLLVFGGPSPGLARLQTSRLGALLGVQVAAITPLRAAQPVPAVEARDLLMWDDDPSRSDWAWREAAPLGDVMPLAAGGGDRVVVGSAGGGPPLLVTRRGGRGQALLVNGTGTWRWSLSGDDPLTAERARKLWRRLVRWLAEPVQAEPLRVRPERWLTARGEVVRLLATLQDAAFRPVSGGRVEADVTGADGHARHVTFTPGASGSYLVALEQLPPGRYRVAAAASRGGHALGRASAEFAIDRWSLEEARALPDSGTLAAIAQATGGREGDARDVATWARGLRSRGVVRGRSVSVRLWESPYVFACIVAMLSMEWIWRRRRGLP